MKVVLAPAATAPHRDPAVRDRAAAFLAPAAQASRIRRHRLTHPKGGKRTTQKSPGENGPNGPRMEPENLSESGPVVRFFPDKSRKDRGSFWVGRKRRKVRETGWRREKDFVVIELSTN